MRIVATTTYVCESTAPGEDCQPSPIHNAVRTATLKCNTSAGQESCLGLWQVRLQRIQVPLQSQRLESALELVIACLARMLL